MPRRVAIIQRTVAANGYEFDVRLAGAAGGEPVILLHGFPQSAGSWDDVARRLVGGHHRTIAPYLRGYCPGANPPGVARYRMKELVADVVGIADALKVGRFHLVGHDWGGGLAWGVAATHPERLASLTVVSTPHPLAMAEAMRTSSQGLRSSYFLYFRMKRVPDVLLSAGNFLQLGLSMRLAGLPAEAWRRDREQLARVGLTGPLNWYRAAALPRGWRDITVPTLYIRGTRDWFLGPRAAELTEQHCAADYEYVQLKAGHWIPDRNADELCALLETHIENHPAARS